MSTLWPRGLGPRSVFSATSTALWLAVAFCGSCASAPPRVAPVIAPPIGVTAESILSEPTIDPLVELEALRKSDSTAAMLRRSFLELRLGHYEAAIDTAAEVVYGNARPTANEEAFARYLRAEAFDQLGKQDRAQQDRERARVLAMDSELQRRLGAVPKTSHVDPTPVSAPSPDVQALQVMPRSAWSPRPPDRNHLEAMGTPKRLTVHHSAMYFRDTKQTACAAQVARIQKDHMENRGYGDIGYHFLIDPSGRIWEGREMRWQGAHCGDTNNIQNIGVCVLGNFLRGREGQGPTAAQVESLQRLVVSLMNRYRFGPDSIRCHSDFKATECPGPLMEPVVAQLVRTLQQQAGGRIAAAAAAGH